MMLPVVAGLFGLIVGSFLNVVVHRLPLGEPLGLFRKTRSQCPQCAAKIAWYDNLPLVSYLLLGGRCRACRWRIPLRYPLVEAITGGLFLLAAIRVRELGLSPDWLAWIVVAAFAAVCVAASAIDFKHKILPDVLTLKVGPVVALVGAVAVVGIHGTVLFGHDLAAGTMKPGMASLIVGVAGAVTGGGIIWLIRALGTLALRREAMGLGDVKFMAMAGLLLGPVPTLYALAVALVGGSVLGVAIWIATRNREIPFGPFLALGVLAVLYYGGAVETFITVTYPTWVRGG